MARRRAKITRIVPPPKPPLLKRALARVKNWFGAKEAPDGGWRSAGGVVVNDKGKIALIRQKKKWTFPKGRVDPGEGLKQAACREVYEETGFQTTIHVYLGVLEGLRHVTHFYLMTIEQDHGVHDDEVDEVRFFEAEKAVLRLGANDRLVLERALLFLDGNAVKGEKINR